MGHGNGKKLEYGCSDRVLRPQRIWLPVLVLVIVFVVWYRPRLTPTFFPDKLDKAMLAAFGFGLLLTAFFNPVRPYLFSAFAGGGVSLFLLANFQDNNFRTNVNAEQIALPWCLMVTGGAVLGFLIAIAARALRHSLFPS